MSAFKVGTFSFPAFSGLRSNINKRSAACSADTGPIPPRTYYIVDREAGGLLGPLLDHLSGRDEWFALLAIDDLIDDHTFCNEVKRGNFRLHPKGPRGISKGCIVINDHSDFHHIRTMLKSASPTGIPGTRYKAYGKVEVA